jgi:hypothetical protein
MRPVYQTKLPPQHKVGNCLAAVVASLLDLSIDEVPNFEVMGKSDLWKQVLAVWFYEYGFYLESDRLIGRHHVYNKPFPRDYENVVYICYGEAMDAPHVVIMANGRLVHDPTPTGAGLDVFKEVWVLRQAVGPANEFNGGRKSRGELLRLDEITYSTVPQVPDY